MVTDCWERLAGWLRFSAGAHHNVASLFYFFFSYVGGLREMKALVAACLHVYCLGDTS